MDKLDGVNFKKRRRDEDNLIKRDLFELGTNKIN